MATPESTSGVYDIVKQPNNRYLYVRRYINNTCITEIYEKNDLNILEFILVILRFNIVQ